MTLQPCSSNIMYKRNHYGRQIQTFTWKNGNEPTIWELSSVVVPQQDLYTVEVIMFWAENSTYGHLKAKHFHLNFLWEVVALRWYREIPSLRPY